MDYGHASERNVLDTGHVSDVLWRPSQD